MLTRGLAEGAQAGGGVSEAAAERSDALVLFGATGDLAYRQIFPALQELVRGGRLDVPVIGVAATPGTADGLRARVRDSLQASGAFDAGAFARRMPLVRYVSGD